MRSLRVLYVWDSDYPWDVRTEKVCATLQAAGHDVHIVARNRGRRPARERLPEGTVHRMRPWTFAGRTLDGLAGFPAFFNPRWIRLIAGSIRAVRPDVIIVRDLPLCPTSIALGRYFGIPVVLDMAENYAAMMNQLWETGRHRPLDVVVRNPRVVAAIERMCATRLDAIITVVEESSRRMRGLGVQAERLVVVSNTPPRSRAERTRPARASDGPVELVYLGLLEMHRGLAEVIEAAAVLRDRGLPVRTHIVGGGRDEAILHRMAAERGLTEADLRFHGRVPHGEALRLIASADIGLVPHRADEAWNTTIPNKLFDYMASGLAVVTSDAEPAARIVRETGSGVVYRSGSGPALADAIASLLDPGKRGACAAAGIAAVKRDYNWERDTAALLDVLDRVVLEASSGGRRT